MALMFKLERLLSIVASLRHCDEDKSGELTFSDQCRLLYALGVIGSNTLSDFLTVARIRNKFAHRATGISF